MIIEQFLINHEWVGGLLLFLFIGLVILFFCWIESDDNDYVPDINDDWRDNE